MSQPVSHIRGTQAFLKQKLTALLPDLNTDLAASVIGGNPPVFAFAVGVPLDPPGPRLATALRFNLADREAQANKIIRVTFDIRALIPVSGENTETAFEMARQVSAEHVLTLLDDDTQMLTPKIDAGLIGVVDAMEGNRGDLVDLDDSLMADNITRVWGWHVPFTLSFSLQTR